MPDFLERKALTGIRLQHAQNEPGKVRVQLVEPLGCLPLAPPDVLQQPVYVVALEWILSSG